MKISWAFSPVPGKLPAKRRSASTASLESTLPLIRRALKILSDREVSPQLGLLKSTLLQLDSTFSERDFGVSSFRDFIQKLANAGHVHLKQVDRSLLVELKDTQEESKAETHEIPAAVPEAVPEIPFAPEQPRLSLHHRKPPASWKNFCANRRSKPHWPMYLRTFKQTAALPSASI